MCRQSWSATQCGRFTAVGNLNLHGCARMAGRGTGSKTVFAALFQRALASENDCRAYHAQGSNRDRQVRRLRASNCADLVLCNADANGRDAGVVRPRKPLRILHHSLERSGIGGRLDRSQSRNQCKQGYQMATHHHELHIVRVVRFVHRRAGCASLRPCSVY